MAKDHVLNAVLDVLAERGVEQLSIRNVAQAAEVSPAQVQYYYRTKRDLVRAAFTVAGDQFLSEVAAAEPQALSDLVLQWLPLDPARERRARVWLAYSEMAAHDRDLAAEASRLDGELRQWFSGAGLTSSQAAQLLALIDGVTVQCLVLPVEGRLTLVEQVLLPFLRDRDFPLSPTGPGAVR